MKNQRTIQKPFTLKGKGLHTGIDVELTMKPADVDHGIVFQRVDLPEKPVIHAIVDLVTETSRGTTLEKNGVKVATIEHVMASLTGMEIDNVLIELSGPEAPILDGSSYYYVEALKDAGVLEQDKEKDYYRVEEKIVYEEPEKGIEIAIYPDDKLSIEVLIDYNSKVLGNQYATLDSLEEFEKEVAPSRTFVFLHELEVLLKHNLIKGGDLDNAIVIMDRKVEQEELDRLSQLFNKPRVTVKPEGILNNIEIHFPNEPARHKLLDLIGDLTLIGKPILGKVVAKRPGHHANTELARIIRKMIKKETTKPKPPFYDPAQAPLFDVNEIMRRLPHRAPFLLVDKITFMDEWEVHGIKNVTMNEAFFMGHFPEEPVMPGVLQVEAMAQVGAVLLTSFVPDPENYLTYFLKIENVKFKRKVVPGDTLNIRMRLTEEIKRGIAITRGQAFVGNTMVIEGEFMAQLAKKPEESIKEVKNSVK
ncbi:MAG: bifunctional UDP-3-O-[3-hydroxymyristoyl] N-acetylglucosamine deacetylase/3-hydroxyacyl-ACP dehydratase [Bacteroidales bacterium]